MTSRETMGRPEWSNMNCLAEEGRPAHEEAGREPPDESIYFSIRNSSRLLPCASASTIQRGARPRPVQVAPVSGSRYFGATGARVVPLEAALVARLAAGRLRRLSAVSSS